MAIAVASNKAVHRAGQGATPPFVAGDSVLPQYTASGNTGTVTWSDGNKGGTFNPATRLSTTYTPANRSQSVTITGTDTVGSDTEPLTVESTFPIFPNIDYPITIDQETFVKFAKDRTMWARTNPVKEFTMRFGAVTRPIAERDAFMQFYDWHEKQKLEFWYSDPELGLLLKCRFDSGIEVMPQGRNLFNLSTIIRGTTLSLALAALVQPQQLPNMVLWLKADGLTGLADGAQIATMTDFSGYGNHPTQGTSTKRPLYKANIKNAKPSARFDGTDDWLTLGDNLQLDLQTGSRTIISAHKFNGGTTGAIIAKSLAASLVGRWGMYYDTNAIHALHQNSGGNQDATTARTPNSWEILEAIYDRVAGQNRVNANGVQIASASYSTDIAQNLNTTSRLLIGAYNNTTDAGELAGFFANMDLLELIVYNDVKTPTELTNLRAYLNAKYAIY